MPTLDPIVLMPLDLDTFGGSERFMEGSVLGAAFTRGMRAYLRAAYPEAIEAFRSALIAMYVENATHVADTLRERSVICLYIGNAFAFQDRWDEALRGYFEAVQIDPGLAEGHYNLGISFAALAQFDRAVAAFKAALNINVNLYEAQLALGRCYQRMDKAGMAYIHYSQACNLRPNAAEPRYHLGLMHQHHGAHELAQRSFADALRVEPTFVTPTVQDDSLVPRSDEEVIEWYYRLCNDLKSQGYDEDAERIYRALLQWKPDEHKARFLLGNLLARSKRWGAALDAYSRISASDKRYLDARLRMSAAYHRLKRHNDAVHILKECLKLFPQDVDLLMQAARMFADMSQDTAALRTLERVVQLAPSNAQAYALLGKLYLRQGRDDWATAAWRKALDLAPDFVTVRSDLGLLYMQHQRYDLAMPELARAYEQNAADMTVTYHLARCYKELGDAARAIPLLEKVVQRDPHNLMALYYLGASYLQAGDEAAGRSYLERYDALLQHMRAERFAIPAEHPVAVVGEKGSVHATAR